MKNKKNNDLPPKGLIGQTKSGGAYCPTKFPLDDRDVLHMLSDITGNSKNKFKQFVLLRPDGLSGDKKCIK